MARGPASAARGYFTELPKLTARPGLSDGLPVLINGGRDYRRWRRAPMLGEHNAEILAELGFTPSEISSLEASGVIGSPPKSR